MPLNWHVNAGPVAYSRPIRKRKGKKSGPLTGIVTWFIVKPLELIFRGGAALVRRSVTTEHRTPGPVATRGYFAPPASQPGWYDTAWGPLYWNGQNWYDLDGRPLF